MTRRDFFHMAASRAAAGIAAISGAEALMAQIRAQAKPLNLKVTDLKTFIVNRGGANGSNYVFVKIYTNQGISGKHHINPSGQRAGAGRIVNACSRSNSAVSYGAKG